MQSTHIGNHVFNIVVDRYRKINYMTMIISGFVLGGSTVQGWGERTRKETQAESQEGYRHHSHYQIWASLSLEMFTRETRNQPVKIYTTRHRAYNRVSYRVLFYLYKSCMQSCWKSEHTTPSTQK